MHSLLSGPNDPLLTMPLWQNRLQRSLAQKNTSLLNTMAGEKQVQNNPDMLYLPHVAFYLQVHRPITADECRLPVAWAEYFNGNSENLFTIFESKMFL